MLEVSGVWEGEKDELKQFRKQFNKLKVAEEDSKLSGWIFERDVAKYATFIGAIRDSKFISLGAQPIEGTGMGRKAKLEVPITLGEAIERTKAHLGLKNIRLVLGVGHSLGKREFLHKYRALYYIYNRKSLWLYSWPFVQ